MHPISHSCAPVPRHSVPYRMHKCILYRTVAPVSRHSVPYQLGCTNASYMHSSTCTKTQCTIPARMHKCILYGTLCQVQVLYHRMHILAGTTVSWYRCYCDGCKCILYRAVAPVPRHSVPQCTIPARMHKCILYRTAAPVPRHSVAYQLG